MDGARRDIRCHLTMELSWVGSRMLPITSPTSGNRNKAMASTRQQNTDRSRERNTMPWSNFSSTFWMVRPEQTAKEGKRQSYCIIRETTKEQTPWSRSPSQSLNVALCVSVFLLVLFSPPLPTTGNLDAALQALQKLSLLRGAHP